MNRLKEQFKKSASVNGSYSVGAIVLVLCVVVLVNMLASRLPESVRKVDVSDNKIYEITDTSIEKAGPEGNRDRLCREEQYR